MRKRKTQGARVTVRIHRVTIENPDVDTPAGNVAICLDHQGVPFTIGGQGGGSGVPGIPTPDPTLERSVDPDGTVRFKRVGRRVNLINEATGEVVTLSRARKLKLRIKEKCLVTRIMETRADGSLELPAPDELKRNMEEGT